MIIGIDNLRALTDSDLLASTRRLVDQDNELNADLLVHLGEIDERRLYLDRAFSSMFAFCVGELGFSEDVAYNRIAVARLSRRIPAVVHAVRSGRVHISGLRLLAPHLTEENNVAVLDEAASKSKREIEELVARLAPKPPVPPTIRKLPERPAAAAPAASQPLISPARADPSSAGAAVAQSAAIPGPPAPPRRPVVEPLAEQAFRVQFTASRSLRDKLKQAQDLLQHQVPGGDLATIIEKAVDLLIDDARKKRFAVGKKQRVTADAGTVDKPTTRHVPDAIKRAVYERDGGRCTFVDDQGRRCAETGGLELDHVDGFARTHAHSVEKIRLLCRAHNGHAADRMYGRAFMDRARAAASRAPLDCQTKEDRIRPGTSPQPSLL